MPRPRFSNWMVQDYTTLAGGASAVVAVDQIDTFYPQYCIKATWQATAATTGYSLYLHRGYDIDGSTVYTDSGDQVTVTSQPAINSGTSVTTINDFSIDAEQYPRFVGFYITNLDATNPMTYKIVADR